MKKFIAIRCEYSNFGCKSLRAFGIYDSKDEAKAAVEANIEQYIKDNDLDPAEVGDCWDIALNDCSDEGCVWNVSEVNC